MDRTQLYREIVRYVHPKSCQKDPEPPQFEPDAVTKECTDIATQIAKLNKAITEVKPRYIAVTPPLQLQPHERQEYDLTFRHFLSVEQKRVRLLEKKEEERNAAPPPSSLGSWLFTNPHLEDISKTISQHRQGMFFYLNIQLQSTSMALAQLHHIQVSREVPPNLHSKDSEIDIPHASIPQNSLPSQESSQESSFQEINFDDSVDLDSGQMQLLTEEHDELLESLNARLEQAQKAERSLQEINSLQSELSQHLSIQSQQLDSLMADAIRTEGNVDDANEQLKRAKISARKYSRMITYICVGLGVFLLIANGR